MTLVVYKSLNNTLFDAERDPPSAERDSSVDLQLVILGGMPECMTVTYRTRIGYLQPSRTTVDPFVIPDRTVEWAQQALPAKRAPIFF